MDVTQRIQSVREFFALLSKDANQLSSLTKSKSFYSSNQDVWGVFGQGTPSQRPTDSQQTKWF
jgi:hypothetical protein